MITVLMPHVALTASFSPPSTMLSVLLITCHNSHSMNVFCVLPFLPLSLHPIFSSWIFDQPLPSNIFFITFNGMKISSPLAILLFQLFKDTQEGILFSHSFSLILLFSDFSFLLATVPFLSSELFLFSQFSNKRAHRDPHRN